MSDKLRRVFVLRQVEIEWKDLRKGDVFRTDPASPTDVYANEGEWRVASSDVELGAKFDDYFVRQSAEPMFEGFKPPVIPLDEGSEVDTSSYEWAEPVYVKGGPPVAPPPEPEKARFARNTKRDTWVWRPDRKEWVRAIR